ncbi:lamin tail domain-containing protein [Streptomyces albiflavescens]|uniref:lamin tail domain-containing protein n=1 Tax=Streptomyces albiflavescens TaxID=1623582 RepID=UPI001E2EDD57|nr:lamin tail domain-containing protein [Streptomyces albiflavescens]
MSASLSVTARRAAAAALAAGALVGAGAASAAADNGAHRYGPYVEISSVQYNSPGHDNRSIRSLNREWVDVTNTSRRSVNLDGWTLSGEDGHTYTFHHYRLEGRATVRIHTGIGRDSDRDLYQDRYDYVWDNYSDTATLRNDRGRVIDTASWGDERRDHDGRRSGDWREDGRDWQDRHEGREDRRDWQDRHEGA